MRELSRTEVNQVNGAASGALGLFGAFLLLPFVALADSATSGGKTSFSQALMNALSTIIY